MDQRGRSVSTLGMQEFCVILGKNAKRYEVGFNGQCESKSSNGHETLRTSEEYVLRTCRQGQSIMEFLDHYPVFCIDKAFTRASDLHLLNVTQMW